MATDVLFDYGRCPNGCVAKMVDSPEEGWQTCPSCGLVARAQTLDMRPWRSPMIPYERYKRCKTCGDPCRMTFCSWKCFMEDEGPVANDNDIDGGNDGGDPLDWDDPAVCGPVDDDEWDDGDMGEDPDRHHKLRGGE